MDDEELQSVFEDKYQKLLGIDLEDWMDQAPKNEAEAYSRCMEIDRELNATYDNWFESTGSEKEQLQEYRDKLKAEYDLIEEMYRLEANDRNW